jgi:hypothetical protein
MRISDIFLYFAQFPLIDGVKSSFSNGTSDLSLYGDLLSKLDGQAHSRLPEIEDYVFGQNLDAVKNRIDKFSGLFLFVEAGDISSNQDDKGSIQDQMKLGVTVARKVADSADLVEQMIVSDEMLILTNRLRALIREDQTSTPWLTWMSQPQQVIPFVSSEFGSVGWSCIFSLSGPDLFDIK